MFVHTRLTNIVPPTFNIFNFFRISPARFTFSKKTLLTLPQPEAHALRQFLTFPQPEALFKNKNDSHQGNAKAVFNISPARSRFFPEGT